MGTACRGGSQHRPLFLIHRRNQKVIQRGMARFRCDIARKPVDDPGLPLENGSRQILQRNRHANPARTNITHEAVIRRRAGDMPGMNQNPVATFQVRRILFELERERLLAGYNAGPTNGAEFLHTKFQPAVIE